MLILAELRGYGRWSDFDFSIWWHWLVLLAILFGSAWLKSGSSDSTKGESEADGEKGDRP